MSLIVQKYGGTSVGNPDRIKNVAGRVAKYHAEGDQIVVVVSAMSGVTDNLITLAKEIMVEFSKRIQVGVAAVNTSKNPLTVEFEGFRVNGP